MPEPFYASPHLNQPCKTSYYPPHLTPEETEAQGGYVAHSGSHVSNNEHGSNRII